MSKAKVFVIMPFKDEFFETYEAIKENFEERFEFSHAGDEDNPQNILADIIMPIYNADIVLVDLTGLNPNVMYELGIAHTMNKKTIIITRDQMSTLPFDLSQYRALGYSSNYTKFRDLLQKLEKYFEGAISGDVVFGNPVRDFLDKNKINLDSVFDKDKPMIDIDETDKGFIDFLADLEEELDEFTNNILDMNNHTDNLTKIMNDFHDDVSNQKDKSGGNSSANFIRKRIKKVSDATNLFSNQMKAHNENYIDHWNNIEKNTLGLLENVFARNTDNIPHLKSYLVSLLELKVSILNSNTVVENAKQSLVEHIGLERTFTSAINKLSPQLDEYLNIMNSIVKSINNIRDKSRYVVGELTEIIEGENNE